MNTRSSDRKFVRKWAQYNADATNTPRWIHLWNGQFWISRTPVEGGDRIDPKPKSPEEN